MPDFGKENTARGKSAPRPGPKGPPQLRTVFGHAESANFRQLTDMVFLSSQELQPQERAFVIDLILVALPASLPAERLRFANRVSAAGLNVKTLLSALANDSDERVAATILTGETPLADDELIALIHASNASRRAMIARRPNLTSAVTTALVSSKDEVAICAALKNDRTQFSPRSIDECVKLAVKHTDLRDPLIKRSEIAPAGALKLFWQMGHRGRAYVLFRFLADDTAFNRINFIPGANGPGEGLSERAKLPPAPDVPKPTLFAQMAAYYTVADIDNAASILADAAGIRAASAALILVDPMGEPLAVVCKAAGAKRAQFVEMCQQSRNLGLSTLAPEVDIEVLAILFDRLSRGQARMAMTYWDWQVAEVGPYAPSSALEKADNVQSGDGADQQPAAPDEPRGEDIDRAEAGKANADSLDIVIDFSLLRSKSPSLKLPRD